MGDLDSIQNNAQKIADEVADARQRWGVDKVNIVAHSKGGIDSRHFVENSDSVEQLIQLGTPNAGSPLADLAQGILVLSIGLPTTVLANGFAGPAGVQLTQPYMASYNLTHGSNSKVKYTALAGDYDPDCPIINLLCRPIDRLLLLITGQGDTIVPVTSVHALGFTENEEDAKHTSLNHSASVYICCCKRPGRNVWHGVFSSSGGVASDRPYGFSCKHNSTGRVADKHYSNRPGDANVLLHDVSLR